MAGYHKMFLIGSGSFGKAWVVETSHPVKQKVLKEMKLKLFSDKDIKHALTEVAVLARCCHDNIIGYTEAFVDESSGCLSIIMDFASGGDLHKKISQRRGLYFSNEVILTWFAQLMSALSYIHRRGILHRDIKPPNLFLNEKQVLKLGDFGVARILDNEMDVALTLVGTPFYFSPEICKQKPYNSKSDMWSAGCVLYELCCLRVPFTAENFPSLALHIQTGCYSPLPGHCSDLLRRLVQDLLVSEPQARLSADQVIHILAVRDEAELPSGKGVGVEEDSPELRVGREHRRKARGCRKSPSGIGCKADSTRCSNLNISDESISPTTAQCPVKQAINSRTYTVLRHPKVRRLSLASPELSSMLHRQRSLSAESQRALSVDAPARKRSTDKAQRPPRLNLFQKFEGSKNTGLSDDDDCADKVPDHCGNELEHSGETKGSKEVCSSTEAMAEILHQHFASGLPAVATASWILQSLEDRFGHRHTQHLLQAVKCKNSYEDLTVLCGSDPNILNAVFWYIQLVGN